MSGAALTAEGQRESITLHEAAHAVVAAQFGVVVMKVGMWCDGSESIGGFIRREPIACDSPDQLLRKACNVIDGVIASAGYAMEETLLGKVRTRSASDDTHINLCLDALELLGEDRTAARESLAKVASEQVRDSLSLIRDLGGALLGRFEEARSKGLTSGAWSVVIEGEELGRLLPDVEDCVATQNEIAIPDR